MQHRWAGCKRFASRRPQSPTYLQVCGLPASSRCSVIARPSSSEFPGATTSEVGAVNGRRGRRALGALVFGAGIGALATEITASRLLAPYFGSSTIVWANLIGIVLAALALGYWLGGRVADRRPRPSLLGFIVLAAALCVAAIPFVAKPFLDLTVEELDGHSAGAVIGIFLAVLLLFAPPVVLLGMVSPFAIRLAISSVATAGAVAGRFYALSTARSLLGTFLPALVLIPAIGTPRTLPGIAALLAGSACLP